MNLLNFLCRLKQHKLKLAKHGRFVAKYSITGSAFRNLLKYLNILAENNPYGRRSTRRFTDTYGRTDPTD
jgi:hypothetical protein